MYSNPVAKQIALRLYSSEFVANYALYYRGNRSIICLTKKKKVPLHFSHYMKSIFFFVREGIFLRIWTVAARTSRIYVQYQIAKVAKISTEHHSRFYILSRYKYISAIVKRVKLEFRQGQIDRLLK